MPPSTAAVRILLLLAIALFTGACSVEPVEVTRIVRQEVTRLVGDSSTVDRESFEVTRLVPRESDAPENDDTVQIGGAEPVTLHLTSTSDIPTLDPQVASDSVSVSHIENLFVQLTNWDPDAGTISPEAARSWEISDDGLSYTFHLRGDIPWVYHNPVTGKSVMLTDESGAQRTVTAHDFVNGIRRACDPEVGSYYGAVLARVIVGCQQLLAGTEDDDMQALVEGVGVEAADAETLLIHLKFPASYFISMTSLWTFSAIPSWTIEEHGDDWIEAGNMVSNGRYVLDEWIHGVRRILVRNQHLPESMQGMGNVERIVVRVVPDTATTYTLWLQQEVDVSLLPDAEVQAHLAQYSELTLKMSEVAVVYIGFVNNKPPFDDPQVRRAFSAAINRETLVRDVRQGQGNPMIHLAPPGVVGAPPIDDVGVGFNPQYARQQLAQAGYEDCERFPRVSIVSFPGQDVLNALEYVQDQWRQHLGCSASNIQIEQQPFAAMLASTASDVPLEEVPHMYALAWAADYPDENNWVGDLLWCGNAGNRTRRACSEVDDMIVEAAREPEIDHRERLYRQIEDAFFGRQGEMPVAPLTQTVYYQTFQAWVKQTPALKTNRWYDWRIDWQAKKDAQE